MQHRRKLKGIHRRPASRRWTEDELRLVGTLPDYQVAALTGRTLAAIQTRRLGNQPDTAGKPNLTGGALNGRSEIRSIPLPISEPPVRCEWHSIGLAARFMFIVHESKMAGEMRHV